MIAQKKRLDAWNAVEEIAARCKKFEPKIPKKWAFKSIAIFPVFLDSFSKNFVLQKMVKNTFKTILELYGINGTRKRVVEVFP